MAQVCWPVSLSVCLLVALLKMLLKDSDYSFRIARQGYKEILSYIVGLIWFTI